MTAFWVSLASALGLTGVLVPLLRRAGVHDLPNDRSMHHVPTPRGGGIAVLFAVLVATATARDVRWGEAGVLLAAALVLGAVGFVDDLRSLSPTLRLATQAVVALMASVAIMRVSGGAGLWGPVFVLVATVAVVAYVNAFNFMDGVNGISALNAVVCGVWLAWLGHHYHVADMLTVGIALAGAALGFLPWNASSRIFLGDVGSYGAGGLVATACVLAWGAGAPAPLVVAPTLVYFADTGWVILKRARAGEPLTQAHRGHVYQRLVQQGWPHWASAAWSAALPALICLVGAVLYDRRPLVSFLLALFLVLAYLATPRLTARTGAAQVRVS